MGSLSKISGYILVLFEIGMPGILHEILHLFLRSEMRGRALPKG
jgi:hypothetical protein